MREALTVSGFQCVAPWNPLFAGTVPFHFRLTDQCFSMPLLFATSTHDNPVATPTSVGLHPLQHAQLVPALGPPALQGTGAPVPDGTGEPQ